MHQNDPNLTSIVCHSHEEIHRNFKFVSVGLRLSIFDFPIGRKVQYFSLKFKVITLVRLSQVAFKTIRWKRTVTVGTTLFSKSDFLKYLRCNE